jgi:hypothetical protein
VTKKNKGLTVELLWLALTLVILVGVIIGPEEKTLGVNVRSVYLHGAWVWTALISLGAAALTGLVGLIVPHSPINCWSRALGRTGIFLWITYLPVSLWTMQANWNGLFLAEPRWRYALVIGVSGILLQIGVSLINKPAITSLANLAFFGTILVTLPAVENVMHPPAPILNSDATVIQIYFLILLAITSLGAFQIARIQYRLSDPCQKIIRDG